MCQLAAPSSPPCEAEEVNAEQMLHGQEGTFTCSPLQPFTEYSVTIDLPPNTTLFSWFFTTQETGKCTEISETRNSPELCHREQDRCSPHPSAQPDHLLSAGMCLASELLGSCGEPCGEGAGRALSRAQPVLIVPLHPTLLCFPLPQHTQPLQGQTPRRESLCSLSLGQELLQPPVASAPARGPVCDPMVCACSAGQAGAAVAGSRQGLSQVERAALLQRGDHRIPGTQGAGQPSPPGLELCAGTLATVGEGQLA